MELICLLNLKSLSKKKKNSKVPCKRAAAGVKGTDAAISAIEKIRWAKI